MSFINSTVHTLKILNTSHISPYKTYVNRQHQIVVCLNPKVGTQAFRETLMEGMQLLKLKPFRSRLWPMNKTRRYTTSPIADFIDAFGNIEKYTFHCFVRNPYNRVLSAWNDKFVKGYYAKNYPPGVRKELSHLRKFAFLNNLEGSNKLEIIPFLTFLSYIESQSEYERNQHWDTQNSVLCFNKIKYNHIYPMETQFKSGMVNILAPLGFDKTWLLEKLKTSVNNSGKVEAFKYTQESAERVYQIYKNDFELLGYTRESWQQP